MPAWALHQYSVYLARRDGVVIDAIKWPNGRDAAVPAGHRYGAAQLMPVGPRAVRCLVARVQDAVRTCTLAKAHLNQGLTYGTLTLGHVMSLLTYQPKLGSSNGSPANHGYFYTHHYHHKTSVLQWRGSLKVGFTPARAVIEEAAADADRLQIAAYLLGCRRASAECYNFPEVTAALYPDTLTNKNFVLKTPRATAVQVRELALTLLPQLPGFGVQPFRSHNRVLLDAATDKGAFYVCASHLRAKITWSGPRVEWTNRATLEEAKADADRLQVAMHLLGARPARTDKYNFPDKTGKLYPTSKLGVFKQQSPSPSRDEIKAKAVTLLSELPGFSRPKSPQKRKRAAAQDDE